MSVKYKLVQRPDFSKGAAKDAKKYFAQMLSNGNVSFDELCESIAEECRREKLFRPFAAYLGPSPERGPQRPAGRVRQHASCGRQ